MLISSDVQNQFVTLIAHEMRAAVRHQFHGFFNQSALIFTDSTQDAGKAISDKLFDLIVIDLDLNGLRLLAQAKASGCVNNSAPILALIGNISNGQICKLIEAGFDDCLTKPLTTENLGEAIKLWQKDDRMSAFFLAIQTFLDKSRDDGSLAFTLYNRLFEEFPEQINQLESAFCKKDYRLAFDITHNINGISRTCYLLDIQETATSLEKCLVQEKYEFADGFFLMLQQQVSLFIQCRLPIFEYLQTLNK